MEAYHEEGGRIPGIVKIGLGTVRYRLSLINMELWICF